MTSLVYSAIRKTFGPTVALESFDLSVAEGELVSLLGPSGCGKTTALRIAAGFEVPDQGTVSVGGEDITTTPAHRRNPCPSRRDTRSAGPASRPRNHNAKKPAPRSRRGRPSAQMLAAL